MKCKTKMPALAIALICTCFSMYMSSPVNDVKSKTFADAAVYPDDYTEEEIARIEEYGSLMALPGDANGNGVVNILDLAFLKQCLLNPEMNMTVLQKTGADINEDLIIDANDYCYIRNIVMTGDVILSGHLDADYYYSKKAKEVLSVEDAATSALTLSESEACSMLAQKGFDAYPVTITFKLNGSYAGDIEADKNSNEKYPVYQTYYVSESGEVWIIHLIGNVITACPVSYVIQSESSVNTLFSEAEALISYFHETSSYYTAIPNESAVSLHVIDDINSKALDELTSEEIAKYVQK